ncbi:flagellar filament capping protein FliD [Thiopseudomonas denitrificans]|uniref:Flagellar hook-associated protein 2 n=1 Tax=Thiopseudomonas denitrificans TaxID=1501432 RepID=A0A4R6TVJ2_9GAMM|nr:flagellar filament capping protein FliD [Thiopseudomonas denitrificans]TDQ36692.1 flagellar hook-associated protein 2 [Thiopseudomonas denitrificans]
MAGITGIGSGMDINSMVGALLQAETAPKAAQLSRLDKAAEAKFSALGTLQGALGTFQTALKDLNKASLYDNLKASSSASDTLGVSAEKTALAGKYSVEVEQLATSSQVATAPLAKDFTAAAAGTLTFGIGADDEKPVSIQVAEGATLTEIRDALNEQLKDKGISANIVNNPADGTSRLVLTSKETGEGKDIQVSGALGDVDFAAGLQTLQPAQNAKFSVDGLQLESATNTVKDVIPDVEFTIKAKTEENKPVTVTVGEDKAGVKSQLKKFVDAYNQLMTTAKDLTRVTSVGEDKAPVTGGLVGDATVRNLVNGVRAELSNPGSGSGDLRALTDLGISLDKDGKLQIDDKKLDAALETNFDQVGNFLTGEGGLMTRMESRISAFAGKDGIIGTRQKSIEAQRSDITKQQERLAERSAKIEARLFKQFNTMDALVGQLSQTSSSLAASLASLPGFGSGN